MGLDFANLDPATRALMVEEIASDVGGRGLYLSNYLTGDGKARWPALLQEAASTGSDDALSAALNRFQCFRERAERQTKNGVTMVAVPYNAAQTLAESQFNMYYMRALARRAMAERRRLVVYRAKETERHRPESDAMIGTALDPQKVLEVLRATLGVEPSIGIPLPNSGLSVRLE
jgi:hypothetical protein